jgi:hypothetical protein
MSVFFEGNAYIDGGHIENVGISTANISNSSIVTSSLDMNMQNITSVKDPIQPQDAATKKYIDDLGIIIEECHLIRDEFTPVIGGGTHGTYTITIKRLNNPGPSAIFNVSKRDADANAHIVRTVATPWFFGDVPVTLLLEWPPVGSSDNGYIKIRKSTTSSAPGGTNDPLDGTYIVKLM